MRLYKTRQGREWEWETLIKSGYMTAVVITSNRQYVNYLQPKQLVFEFFNGHLNAAEHTVELKLISIPSFSTPPLSHHHNPENSITFIPLMPAQYKCSCVDYLPMLLRHAGDDPPL